MAGLWDDDQASSNNMLGRYDSWSGVIELSKELGGNGTLRERSAQVCSAL
jgi:hypothetical protein